MELHEIVNRRNNGTGKVCQYCFRITLRRGANLRKAEQGELLFFDRLPEPELTGFLKVFQAKSSDRAALDL